MGGGGYCLEMGDSCHIVLSFFPDAAQEKYRNVFIFPLLTNMCHKIVT